MSNVESKVLVSEFCKVCDWAYECWITHRMLFDDNRDKENTIGKFKFLSLRISTITLEYILLQISKLHDPIEIRGRTNITIDTVLKSQNWGADERKLNELRDNLLGLWTNIKTTRHKIICHNDLEAILESGNSGEFTKNLDRKYFESLQEFVNIIHEKTNGRIFPFSDVVKNDVDEFLEMVVKA